MLCICMPFVCDGVECSYYFAVLLMQCIYIRAHITGWVYCPLPCSTGRTSGHCGALT